MKVLVTGSSGQLGFDVILEGKKRGYQMIGTGSKDLDIRNEENVKEIVKNNKPDIIIHCAAYTAVDKSEEEKEICWDVNVNGTKYLVDSAKSIDAKFIYISTDYVFNGEGNKPYIESDKVKPIGYYGLTKEQGEKIVQKNLDKFYIVRISWVFGINGKNFIKTMLQLSETKNELNVVGDQFGSPTYTVDLAKLLIDMAEVENYGIYHASNEGYCSWAEFAREIFKISKKEIIVNSISTEQYPTTAARPKNSRLSKQKLTNNGFSLLPTWKDALIRYIDELKKR